MIRTKKILATVLLGGMIVTMSTQSFADLLVGDKATLFKSVDENMNPIDMADLIDGKPLVLVVSSCS